jgi:hypothetical protein
MQLRTSLCGHEIDMSDPVEASTSVPGAACMWAHEGAHQSDRAAAFRWAPAAGCRSAQGAAPLCRSRRGFIGRSRWRAFGRPKRRALSRRRRRSQCGAWRWLICRSMPHPLRQQLASDRAPASRTEEPQYDATVLSDRPRSRPHPLANGARRTLTRKAQRPREETWSKQLRSLHQLTFRP